MALHETEHLVRAWTFQDTLLEWHCYPPGPPGELPPHVHDEYQICLSLDFPGEYRLRRARHPVPVGSLSIIHPGEVHAARDPWERRTPASYRLLYVRADRLAALAGRIRGGAPEPPTFRTPIIRDAPLASRLHLFHRASEASRSRLEVDERLLSVLTGLILRHGDAAAFPPAVGSERRAMRFVREYLDSHYAEDVSLDHLARLADLSPYHLTRTFHREIGLPPHAYQLGVRISRAKTLLLYGNPPARVAAETGFADQSHFTRHFKRYVGTSPGRYLRERKIVQDGQG